MPRITAPFGSIVGASYIRATAGGSLFVGRKARGTSAAPTAVQNGDNLVGFLAAGYGATAFSWHPRRHVRARGGKLDGHGPGNSLDFNTTATGTNTPATRMTIDPPATSASARTAPSAAAGNRDGTAPAP